MFCCIVCCSRRLCGPGRCIYFVPGPTTLAVRPDQLPVSDGSSFNHVRRSGESCSICCVVTDNDFMFWLLWTNKQWKVSDALCGFYHQHKKIMCVRACVTVCVRACVRVLHAERQGQCSWTYNGLFIFYGVPL